MANNNPMLTLEADRDEMAMAYTALFYITNNQGSLPVGHPPTPAQTMQLRLAKVLGEDVPEAALQDIQRQLDEATELAARRQQMRAEIERRAAEAAQTVREEAEAETRQGQATRLPVPDAPTPEPQPQDQVAPAPDAVDPPIEATEPQPQEQ